LTSAKQATIFLYVKKTKLSAKPVKNKGGRPKKTAILATGKEAAVRFESAMRFALKGGPHPTGKE
jgi:hypothetical protein